MFRWLMLPLTMLVAWCCWGAGTSVAHAGTPVMGAPGEAAPLERVASDPGLATDRAAIDSLSAESDTLSDDKTRLTTDLFLGEAYRGRLQNPARAAHHLRRAASSAHVDPLTRRLVEGALVDVLVAQRSFDEALALALRVGDPDVVTRARTALRRHHARLASIAGVASFVALAAVALLRAARARRLGVAGPPLRSFVGYALAFGVWLGGAGGFIASSYDASDPSPFFRLAIVVVPIVILARAWGLVGAPSPLARLGRGALAAQAGLAASFLALHSVDPRLLTSFGL